MEKGEGDWDEVRALDNRLQRGEALHLTDDVRDLLRRTAPTVGMSEAEAETALTSIEGASGLLRKMRRQIDDGSNRLTDALRRMYRLQERGDLDGARQQMRDVLLVEVVPLYREVAEDEIAKMDNPDE